MLLPFDEGGDVDWSSFGGLLERTVAAGLTPAVNMDTGYVQLLDAGTRLRVLDVAAEIAAGDFVAGAQVPDEAGDALDIAGYQRAAQTIEERGGVPVIFPRTVSARWTARGGSKPTAHSQARAIASSPSSSARCSCPMAASTSSRPTGR